MLFDYRGGVGGSGRAVKDGGVGGGGGIGGGAWLEAGGSEGPGIELELEHFDRFINFEGDTDGFGGASDSRDAPSYDAYYDAQEEARLVRIAQMDTKDPKEFEEVGRSVWTVVHCAQQQNYTNVGTQ